MEIITCTVVCGSPNGEPKNGTIYLFHQNCIICKQGTGNLSYFPATMLNETFVT